MFSPGDVSRLLPGHESRSASFENPTGARGAGGMAADGRKGAAWRLIRAGESVTLASFEGPGTVTHIWLTLSERGGPEPGFLRRQVLEVRYGDLQAPSVSVPVGDYFGAVHGVASPYASTLTAVNEGRGYASRVPLPFRDAIAMTYTNRSSNAVILYYQVDVLLGPLSDDAGHLHATFRRENPTTLGRDFVVWDGLRGPGRFLGWTGGVRVLDDRWWWGEGEMKFYFDGETTPTICGTGTEDYLDSAWGLGTFHAPETGAPLVCSRISPKDDSRHSLISFYRWHVSDPVVFKESLRATIQQIGAAAFVQGQESEYRSFRSSVEAAGGGWMERGLPPPLAALGLYERSDDWCGTAFCYLAEPQAVAPVDVDAAAADLPADPGELVLRDAQPGR